MGSRDGFFASKLLNDFVYWRTCPDKIGTIIVNNLVYRDHPSLKIRGVPKDVRSYDVKRVCNKEQLSTRVGCGRAHPIIENVLDKCRVVAPNLPTKTDDQSHSTGYGWAI
uniref:Uncharacterized protein n=1 Tax=Oryza glaberrima TaxID=4538 RepID=I1NN29_ORYGL